MDCGPGIDFSGAKILGDIASRNPSIFLPRLQPAACPLVALDIGVYATSCGDGSNGAELRFASFERRRLDDCLEFLREEELIRCKGTSLPPPLTTLALWDVVEQSKCNAKVWVFKVFGGSESFSVPNRGYEFSVDVVRWHVLLPATGIIFKILNRDHVQATGGGAYDFADNIREKLDVYLHKVHEFECIVYGSNFLLEATGKRNFEFVTSTNIGGAFVFGLAKLLTGCKSYDEFLQLCQKGDNSVLDLVVKDICGEFSSLKQGFSASTLASSFGRVITSNKKLSDYKSEDLASTLLSAFTYNIAQIAFLVASLMGLHRVVFSGSFICGHKISMENISSAIDAWSQRQIQAVFLRHEGYLGAICAFLSYADPSAENVTFEESTGTCSFHECLEHLDGTSEHEKNGSDIFPYLFVNIGPGVSMVEVSSKGKFKRITGSHIGGGTILGLAKLLTGCSSFEEFLELSQRGNNESVDLTIKDLFGEGYRKMVYLMTKILGVKRIFFRGAFVCGHEKIMGKISQFLEQRLKGEVQLTFLCREGSLGTLGSFWSYENMGIDGLVGHEDMREVLLGAPYTGQFQSLAHGQNKRFEGEVKDLWREDVVLKVEVDLLQLQRENAELKAKLVDNAMLKAEVERLRRENAELNARIM
ncbi:hypothetical protein EJB05_45775 [Eragrostis curvula]|uniref:Damage-control phosphatase ARMT1-like metal-binding domain-containing protein n=1 Tax=Eragrostis curvula TaxID=38414 RepID=A0A5J9TL22_9POAL|nr:hypothetical protein EJB05_45775 [Eragrostis curvula]